MVISKGTRWFAKGSLMVLAIYLGSMSLIRYALAPPSAAKESAAPKTIKQPPANEARFRASFEAGTRALSDGRYATALDNFLEAERSVDQLTDKQYESLKQARLQLAQTYENIGDSFETSRVYRALADCANRQGQTLLSAKQYDAALSRAQDAEQFSNHLTEDKRESLQQSISLLVSSLSLLHRYPEAIEAQQRLIDYLKGSVPDSDPYFVQAYMALEGVYADANDWQGTEQTLISTIDACDRAERSNPSSGLSVTRNWAQYNLIIAYYHAEGADTALTKADEFYTMYSQLHPDPMHPVSVAYQADAFAGLALQIAKETNRQDAIDYWQKRAPGGIRIIALHPLSTH